MVNYIILIQEDSIMTKIKKESKKKHIKNRCQKKVSFKKKMNLKVRATINLN